MPDKKDNRIYSGLPEAVRPGEETPVQISPFGDWPGTTQDGGKVIQHVDGRAVSRLVENFSNEILVDADHKSETGGSTEALAWITELRNDPERGLVGVFKWTDTGAEAITGRRYRFVSASWTTDPDGRPGRLCSVALTNRPNIPAAPILNSVREEAPTPTKEQQPERKNDMENILAQLQLAPDATEEQAVNAIAALQQELEEVKRAAAEKEADQFVENHKALVLDPKILRNAYLANPELARQMVDNMRPQSQVKAADRIGQPVMNSSPTGGQEPPAPKTVCNSKGAERPVLNGIAQCKSPQERVAFIKAHAAEMALI